MASHLANSAPEYSSQATAQSPNEEIRTDIDPSQGSVVEAAAYDPDSIDSDYVPDQDPSESDGDSEVSSPGRNETEANSRTSEASEEKSGVGSDGLSSQAEHALRQVLEARRPLREEIEAAIDPNFDDANAIVCEGTAVAAIICSEKEFITENEMLQWISRTFPSFHDIPTDLKLPDDAREGSRISPFGPGLNYDAPFIIKDYTEQGGERRYSIDPSAARICLRNILEPPREGTFRFLDLPAELRNRVYELLLNFSDSQIVYFSHDCLVLACRACAIKDDESMNHALCCPDNYSSGCAAATAPMLVSRQLYNEAMPIFWGINRFTFTVVELGHLLTALSNDTARRIKTLHVAIDWAKNKEQFSAGFAKLEKVLHKLSLLDELAFTPYVSDVNPACVEAPGSDCLVKLAAGAKSINFYKCSGQEGEQLQKFIKDGLEKLKLEGRMAEGRSGKEETVRAEDEGTK